MSSTTKTVTKAAGIMMAAIFLSRILGLVREMVIANRFGGGADVSSYVMAFNLPDLLYFLLSGGVLSAAFIPVFTSYLEEGKEDEAWKVFSVIGTLLFIVLGGLILFFEVFTHQLMPLVAPGFMDKPVLLKQTVMMTRILLPCQLFFFLGGLIIATLNSRQHFLAPALGPVIYNVGIIAGGLFLSQYFGIASLTYGALGGAFLGNFLLQIIVVRRFGVKFKPSLDLRHPGVRRVGKLALPVILGLSLPYVDVYVNRWFSTFINEGSAAALNFANRLMQMPLGVFGQAAAIAFFPTMAAQAARKEMGQLRASVNFGLRGILLMTVPSSVLMVVLASPIVTMLFQHGKFSADNGAAASSALVFYAIGIAGWAGQAIVTRGFYAMQDTLVPVVTGTVMTAIFIPLNWILMKPLGHAGLALATSVAAILNLIALIEIFRRRMGGINGGLIVKSFAKVSVSSTLAGVMAWTVLHVLKQKMGIDTPLHAMIAVIGSAIPAVVVYIGMIAVLKVDEAREVWKLLSARFRRRAVPAV